MTPTEKTLRDALATYLPRFMASDMAVYAAKEIMAALTATSATEAPGEKGGYSKSARDSLQLQIIEDLLTDPEYEYDSGVDADYTTPLTDKVHALVKTTQHTTAAGSVEHRQAEIAINGIARFVAADKGNLALFLDDDVGVLKAYINAHSGKVEVKGLKDWRQIMEKLAEREIAACMSLKDPK